MPMYDLNSDERDDDRIEWRAGGRSEVAVLIDGERVAVRTIQKGQSVMIAWSDETGGEADE